MISVLMITYNHERFIETAVNSVLSQQTEYPFELVIGEDNSTDATGKKVDALAAAFPHIIKVVRGEHNVGVAANFCKTFQACSGKYLAILDGDDYWTDPLKLQKQVSFMEANPEYGFVHADVNHYYEENGKTDACVNKTNHVRVPNGDLFPDLIRPDPLFIKTATVCFRRALAEHFDFERSIREKWPLLDLPLWMDITRHTQSYYFDEVFATYRLLNESASRMTSPEKKYRYHKALYGIKQLYFDKYHVAPGIRQAVAEAYHRGMIRIAYTMGSASVSEEAVKALQDAKANITTKERVLIFAAKNGWFKKLMKLIKA